MTTTHKRSLTKGNVAPQQQHSKHGMPEIIEQEQQQQQNHAPPKQDKHRRRKNHDKTPPRADVSSTLDREETGMEAGDEQEEAEGEEADDSAWRDAKPARTLTFKLYSSRSNTPISFSSPGPRRPATQTKHLFSDGEAELALGRHFSRQNSIDPHNGSLLTGAHSDGESYNEASLDAQDAILRQLKAHNGVMITWTDNEGDSSISEAEEFAEARDMEELLAWGNDELHLDGMPEVSDDPKWIQPSSFLEIELAGSETEEDEAVGDSDVSIDTAEEEENMLVLNSLYDSDASGDTTDTLDDTDAAGLARFGIEQTDEDWLCIRPEKTRKGYQSTKDKPLEPLSATQTNGPVLGSFKSAQVAKDIIVLSEGKAKVLSPFSVSKIRTLRLGDQSSPSRRQVKSRRDSMLSSTSASTSIITESNAPSEEIKSVIEEEEEGDYMDLDVDDILDLADGEEVTAEFDLVIGGESDGETTDCETPTVSLSNLSRWNKIPIGAFRRAKNAYKSPLLSALKGPGFSARDAPIYLPVSGLSRDTVSVRLPSYGNKVFEKKTRKITRAEAIGLSPMLCPVQANVGDRAPHSPDSVKSRRQKRKDKKLKKKSHLPSPAAAEHSSSSADVNAQLTSHAPHIADAEVPPLDLPAASQAFDVPPTPTNMLPVPTLPSAECGPAASPLFAAVSRPPANLFPTI